MSIQVKKHLRAPLRHKGQGIRKAHIRFLNGKKRISPNAVTLAAMDNALAGRDMHGPFDSVEALMADLNA